MNTYTHTRLTVGMLTLSVFTVGITSAISAQSHEQASLMSWFHDNFCVRMGIGCNMFTAPTPPALHTKTAPAQVQHTAPSTPTDTVTHTCSGEFNICSRTDGTVCANDGKMITDPDSTHNCSLGNKPGRCYKCSGGGTPQRQQQQTLSGSPTCKGDYNLCSRGKADHLCPDNTKLETDPDYAANNCTVGNQGGRCYTCIPLTGGGVTGGGATGGGQDCRPDQCGVQPEMPNRLCPNGTVAGPGACRRDQNGRCSWEIKTCEQTTSNPGGDSGAACRSSVKYNSAMQRIAGDCPLDQHCSVDDGVCNPNPSCTGDFCTSECWGNCKPGAAGGGNGGGGIRCGDGICAASEANTCPSDCEQNGTSCPATFQCIPNNTAFNCFGGTMQRQGSCSSGAGTCLRCGPITTDIVKCPSDFLCTDSYQGDHLYRIAMECGNTADGNPLGYHLVFPTDVAQQKCGRISNPGVCYLCVPRAGGGGVGGVSGGGGSMVAGGGGAVVGGGVAGGAGGGSHTDGTTCQTCDLPPGPYCSDGTRMNASCVWRSNQCVTITNCSTTTHTDGTDCKGCLLPPGSHCSDGSSPRQIFNIDSGCVYVSNKCTANRTCTVTHTGGPVCGDGKCEQGEYFCGSNTPACVIAGYPGHDECVAQVKACETQNPNPCSKDCPVP